jgi:hypothetical protein
MNTDGTIKYWGCPEKPEPCGPEDRPQPTIYEGVQDFDWPVLRSGFQLYGQGILENNVFRDIFAWGNAGLGFSNYRPFGPAPVNCQIDHATIINNGLDAPATDGGIGTDALNSQLEECSVTNSFIEGTQYQDVGARLTHRYIDGVLTDIPLWPWPMEDRIQSELGLSVTDLMTNLIFGTTNLNEIYP